jgi:UPF0755 protein
VRFLPVLAAVLTLGMTAATAWTILGSPDLVDEVPATPAPTPSASPKPVSVSVEQGQGVIEIGDALEDAGVIDSAIQFRVLVAFLGYEKTLQAGDYEFEPDMPALQVVYRMRRGVVSPNFVTVVEGWRLEEVAGALDEKGIISREEFLEAAVAGNFDGFDFLDRLGPQTPLEGYLLPATYFYRRSDTAEDVIQQMLEAMDKGFTPELRGEALDAGLTMHGVLTLASIIEREAKVAEERPIMAQVFLKRLRLGISLEADPTVQYAVAEDPDSVEEFGYWKTALTEDDLAVDSLYNTYRYGGLPPGPISAPRTDSILAVIHPSDTNFLFFVARPDGSHAFSETFEEHQQNIEEFQP